ncbi:hypothetical protein MBLNU230_g3270t1 [Neophaeotheca triangularis]
MKTTTYLGYGSNLWRSQMQSRCPTAGFVGIARLRGFRWMINQRGYANVVEIDPSIEIEAWKGERVVTGSEVGREGVGYDGDDGDGKGKGRKHDYTHEVWGLVYTLRKADEEGLDGNEGVPVAYTKEYLECDFWPLDSSFSSKQLQAQTPSSNNKNSFAPSDNTPAPNLPIDTSKPPQKTTMLVYINRKQITDANPKTEYVYRMNQGVKDGLEAGVPEGYVEEVIREFIPAE